MLVLKGEIRWIFCSANPISPFYVNLNMEWKEHIVSDESVLLGKPTVKGTRISVEHIIGLLAEGWTEQQILENYPRLSQESLQSVFSYIQDCLKDGLLYSNA